MKRLFADSSRTSTSAVAESFTEDIVIEILLRLPVKSLMRFKCVTKRWQSLISDPGFAKSHLQRLNAGDVISSQRIFKISPLETIDYEVLDGGIGSDDDRAVVKFHEPRLDVSSWDLRLVGSCDGLVCLSVHGRFVLYNPTTRESRNLPDSDFFQIDDIVCGFGYDSRSDDYKIVQGKEGKGPDWLDKWEVVIFSLKSGSWRRTQALFKRDLSLILSLLETGGRGVYWNGALHWCVTNLGKEKTKIAVISFDLSEEKFQEVLSVPQVNGDIRFKGFGIYGANLLMYHGTYDDCFQAWTTSEYRKGGSWTKFFSFSTKGLPYYHSREVMPVAYTRSGKIVSCFYMYQMILFNPKDNTYMDYPIQKRGDIDSVIYVETLVSPYHGCESRAS